MVPVVIRRTRSRTNRRAEWTRREEVSRWSPPRMWTPAPVEAPPSTPAALPAPRTESPPRRRPGIPRVSPAAPSWRRHRPWRRRPSRRGARWILQRRGRERTLSTRRRGATAGAGAATTPPRSSRRTWCPPPARSTPVGWVPPVGGAAAQPLVGAPRWATEALAAPRSCGGGSWGAATGGCDRRSRSPRSRTGRAGSAPPVSSPGIPSSCCTDSNPCSTADQTKRPKFRVRFHELIVYLLPRIRRALDGLLTVLPPSPRIRRRSSLTAALRLAYRHRHHPLLRRPPAAPVHPLQLFKSTRIECD